MSDCDAVTAWVGDDTEWVSCDIWLAFMEQFVCYGTASVHLCCVYEGQGQGDAASASR
jgi:hypothetical protein